MATGVPPRVFQLPQGRLHVSVHAADSIIGANLDMLESVSIAASEGFAGFGVWLRNLLLPPRMSLPSGSAAEHQTFRLQLRERLVAFYVKSFSDAWNKRAGCVYLPLLSASGHYDELVADALVHALMTFEITPCITQLLCPLKEFRVVGKGAPMDHVITQLDAQLKKIVLTGGFFSRIFSRNVVRHRKSAKNGDKKPFTLSSPSPLSVPSCICQPVHILRPLYTEAFMLQKFAQGGIVHVWGNPQDIHTITQWRAAVDPQAKGGNHQHCKRVIQSAGEITGGNPASGKTTGPCSQAQYFFLLDQDSRMRSSYFVCRKHSSRKGKVAAVGPAGITRCWYSQKVVGHNGFSLDNYITDAGRGAAETPQPRRSDSRASNKDGEATAAKADSRTSSSEADKTAARADVQHDDRCAVCLTAYQQPVQLKKCRHVFCRQCLELSFRHRSRCPLCQEVIVVTSGNMPNGIMSVYGSPSRLPGHEDSTIIVIEYDIYSGIQQDSHPNPGVAFVGTRRRAYLPASEDGFRVCRLLWVAFALRLTFTVGHSMTTGHDNVVTWNDIHHKTSTEGGPENFGYPDTGYLRRVKEELAQKGITEDFLQGFSIPF